MKDNSVVTTNLIEDRQNLKFGARHVSLDENGIFIRINKEIV